MSHNDDVVVEKVREVIKDRALYLALLYRSFSQALPPDQVERLAREAIYEYGRIKGQKDAGKMTPEEWVDKHMSKGSGAVLVTHRQGRRLLRAANDLLPPVGGLERTGMQPGRNRPTLRYYYGSGSWACGLSRHPVGDP